MPIIVGAKLACQVETVNQWIMGLCFEPAESLREPDVAGL